MTPLVVDPSGYLKPHHSVGHCPPRIPVRDAVPPYTSAEEAVFCRAAMLPGRLNRAARLWVVVATFGAGLTGVEAGRAVPDDLMERADGRIVVKVRGRDSKTRIVPIRSAYTDLAREAVEASDGTTFFRGTGGDRAQSHRRAASR